MSRHSVFSHFFEREEQHDRDAKVYGLWLAQVDSLDDDGYILRWLTGHVDELSSPARIATLMAGADRGSFFMPEQGDEVVVAFENGDFDQPIILGALWNDEDDPPPQADTSASNNVRTLVSRAGHEITFDDNSDGGKILIKTNGGNSVELSDKDAKILISDSNGNTVELSSDGITFNSGSTINIKAPTINIEATGTLTAKGQLIDLNP